MGFNFAPRGNALCDGQILPINQNQSLFSLLGTTFGGDGRRTFGLPDLRGRVPVSPGNAGTNVNHGQKSGQERHMLAMTEMPSHQHRLTASASPATESEPEPANVFANCDTNAYRSASGADLLDMSTEMIKNTGGNQSHDNMQPWLSVTFVIALQGLFPSRN
jgi:microcystin-dependent protein